MKIKEDIEGLVFKAIKVCLKENYDKVSPYLFQRRLAIDFYTAVWITGELKKRKVLINPIYENEDKEENVIFEVDKIKLNSYFKN